MSTRLHEDEPMYVISVAARLVQMHPQTLRYYERAGLVKPTRSGGRIRLYSQTDLERLRKIARLTSELGVNLAGVQVIMDLTEKLERLQSQLQDPEGWLEEGEIVDSVAAEMKAVSVASTPSHGPSPERRTRPRSSKLQTSSMKRQK